MNQLSYGRDNYDRCDGSGNQCEDHRKETHWSVGVGGAGGYLLTDLVEVGGVEMLRAGFKTEHAQTNFTSESPYWSVSVSGYGKLHFDIGSRFVPYVSAGGGWRYAQDEYQSGGSDVYEDKYSGFLMFGAGGVQFFVEEKYAIYCFTRFTYEFESSDHDINTTSVFVSDYDEKLRGYALIFGLGVMTYF